MKNKIYHFKKVASTNTKARELIKKKSEKEFAVIAERQTKGRGRRGHIWESPEGGLYLSVVIDPGCRADEINRLYIVSGYAVASALKEITGADIKIKWPNDIIYNDKKLAGILIETSISKEKLDYAIIGIGVNIKGDNKALPENSININRLTDSNITADDLAVKIMIEIKKNQLFLNNNFDKLIGRWQEFCDIIGRKVKITYKDRQIEGKIRGVDKNTGALILERHGKREIINDLGYISQESMP